MEKYEPTVKNHQSLKQRGHATVSPNHKPHSDCFNEIQQLDYAYAYYEPGAPMRHKNVPGLYDEAGPSRPPPPNSIRALLSTVRKNNMQRASDSCSLHASTMGPKSHDNVYEEVNDAEKRRMLCASGSIVSLNHSIIEEEFKRVKNRHQRVLGELNLSVEEMLMPPPPKAYITTSSMDFLVHGEEIDGLAGAGSNNNVNIDMDSGFSGSNSSYIGSLRYQKSCTTKKGTSTLLTINQSDSGSSVYGGSSVSTTDEIGMISLSSRSSSSLFDSGKKSNQQRLKNPSPSNDRSGKLQFWKNKAWRNKIPGFSSTSSINKTGMGEYNFFFF